MKWPSCPLWAHPFHHLKGVVRSRDGGLGFRVLGDGDALGEFRGVALVCRRFSALMISPAGQNVSEVHNDSLCRIHFINTSLGLVVAQLLKQRAANSGSSQQARPYSRSFDDSAVCQFVLTSFHLRLCLLLLAMIGFRFVIVDQSEEIKQLLHY